jgi:next to BRCA1 gene 1 protein
MHPECPDYDLCENCEAFPIAVHPSNHPMLKMKSPDTAIPTVYRVGQTRVIEPAVVINERQTSIHTSKSPESTPSGIAYKVPLPGPSVPVHDIPAPPVRARSGSPVEDMRSCTPVARSPLDDIVVEKTEAPCNQIQVGSPRRLPTPEPPKLPPKPEMISQQSWASIPDFFNAAPRPQYVPHNAFVPLPIQNTFGNSQFSFGTIQRPDGAQPPAPAISTPLLPQVAPEDNNRVLPSVPNHTTNPWPTTNPSEKEELLKLIAAFSGPSIPVSPRRPVSPITFYKPLEHQAGTPPRNNPFLTPPRTAVELLQPITSSVVEPPAESRPWANDSLPSWASLTPDVSHLVGENHFAEPKPASIVSEPTSIVGSPLSGEALLSRPASSGLTTSSSYPRSLAELIHQLPTLVPSKVPSVEKLPEDRQVLSAKFVDDVTVPDGQVFPPGAEFVKCWRLLNNSDCDWPENTELVFLAGDPLSDSPLPPVLIGQVVAGAEFEVWTGELKVWLTIGGID